MKVREVYKEAYKPGALIVSDPPARLPYMAEGWRIDEMEIRANGRLSDGREFQDIRVYVVPAPRAVEGGK